MKIDATIKITNTPDPEIVAKGEIINYPVDMDYVSDLDDIINEIEIQLFADYGIALNYKVNFEIANAQELCDELFKYN